MKGIDQRTADALESARLLATADVLIRECERMGADIAECTLKWRDPDNDTIAYYDAELTLRIIRRKP